MKKIKKVLTFVAAGLVHFALSTNANAQQDLKVENDHLSVHISQQGFVSSLKSFKRSISNLSPKDSPLAQIKTFDSKEFISPHKMTWKDLGKFVKIELFFKDHQATIRAQKKADYLTFELVSLQGNDIDEWIWGPYNVNMHTTIAESLGSASDDKYTFGLLTLNIKTTGGYPTPSISNKVNTSIRVKGTGSRLMAFSRNRSISREINPWIYRQVKVAPISGENVMGSKIALYASLNKEQLNTIERIVVGEKLPYPKRDGVWMKKHPVANSSKLITGFNQGNFDMFLKLAEDAGIPCIYTDNVFKSWGTFEVAPGLFPGGMKALKECVQKAKAKGITVGTHTLSNFIHPHDPLITPIPHPNLQKCAETSLRKDINKDDTEIELANTTDILAYGKDPKGQKRAVQIGNEIIEYSSCTQKTPYTLLGCVRGAFGTKNTKHRAQTSISKLTSHSYGTFFPDFYLQDQMAKKLAEFFNESGFKRLSFDGLEGCQVTGHGDYAEEMYMKTFYDHLDSKDVIMNASKLTHFAWHYNSNESWGEPWYDNFRNSMLDYRLQMQDFLTRNMLPSKMGQFTITEKVTIEDINWLMGLCAGLGSGVDFYIQPSIYEKHPDAKALLNTIKRWEKARNSKVFTEKEKEVLRDTNTIYSLKDDSFELVFVKDWAKEAKEKKEKEMTLMKGAFGDDNLWSNISEDFIHINKPREPGQPTAAIWSITNEGNSQPFQFVMRSAKENKQIVKDAYVKVGAIVCKLPFEISAGEYVVARGGGKLSHFSASNKLLQDTTVKELTLASGKNTIEFNNYRNGKEPGPKVIVNFKTYLPEYTFATPVNRKKLTEEDIAGMKGALLAVELHDSDIGHYLKHIEINGQQVTTVPKCKTPGFKLNFITIPKDQLGGMKTTNKIKFTGGAGDAYKMRNVTLYVQLKDGSWVRSNTDNSVYSSQKKKDWALSEGKCMNPISMDILF